MMTIHTCPWCEEPVTSEGPTVITMLSLGQTILLHPVCGAQLFNAGMQAKPSKSRPVRARRKATHPATAEGAAELGAYTGHLRLDQHESTESSPRRLMLVRDPA